VVRTRVGYAGGTTKAPTYTSMGDHSEAFQLDFDPTVISYEQLLARVWSGHDPRMVGSSRQYRAAIFVHGPAQRRAVEKTANALASKLVVSRSQIVTPIEAFSGFTLAEDYHQKHRLQGRPALARELRRHYPVFRDFVDSTAAARLNGYLAGHGSAKQLAVELGDLGLSAEGRAYLQKLRG
jgi:peptide-methionine (S)-S-oxide reductase